MSTPTESSARPATSAPLLGFWYPATLATAVRPGKMSAQVLLGLPLLICRDSQGRLAALRDICPHRGMPLSFGHFDGTRLECCYHGDRKSTRLNSSHGSISYAVFCLKKKKQQLSQRERL